MSVLVTQIRAGAYADSIVLMQLQSDLQRLAGILDAGVVMGAAVNLELLKASGLLDDTSQSAGTEDLVIAVRAESDQHAAEALAQIDTLMQRRQSHAGGDFRPHSLRSAKGMAPEARWVSISVPGRYAHSVAQEALDLGCHVFLYSDNVTLANEVELKSMAAAQGLLLMGPDCGSAMIGGIGFGFTNVVRPGPIGMVCASGTGLQAISSRIHQLGSGISHAIGTGGRDLSSEVQGATARQGLDLLGQDTSTEIIVLASKPPDVGISAQILAQAQSLEKPVVVYFSGQAAATPTVGNLLFVNSLSEAAETAVAVAQGDEWSSSGRLEAQVSGRYLRGLFAGGTLSLEAVQVFKSLINPLYSNLDIGGVMPLPDPTVSVEHTLLDLGADEYTVGRLHPMMDQRLRIERLVQEAADPETGLILLDVVLGLGAHADPATDLAPVLTEIKSQRDLPIFVLVVGTDEDPQDLSATVDRLTGAGAKVYTEISRCFSDAARYCAPVPTPTEPAIGLAALRPPQAAINVGLESLSEDLVAQGVETIQMEWRPPAGGNEKLMAILERMKK